MIMATRYRLLERAQIDGAVQEPGYIFTLPPGVRPPYESRHAGHQTMNPVDGSMNLPPMTPDRPMFEPVDEAVEKESADMAARHAKELDELDLTKKREALLKKHAEERAALRVKAADAAAKRRQDEESAWLKERQAAEAKAYKDKAPVSVPTPTDATEADLKARHAAEAKKLAEDHAAEEKALKEKNAPPAAATAAPAAAPVTPAKAWSVADEHPKPPATPQV
jgi:hypothetical protein